MTESASRITSRRIRARGDLPSREHARAPVAGPREDATDAYLARVMKHDRADAWMPVPLGGGRTLWKPRAADA